MHNKENNFAFIDNTNVHKGIQMLGWKLDLTKFRKLLAEGYGVSPHPLYFFLFGF